MIYRILRPVVFLFVRIFYKNFRIKGLHHLSVKGPVILSPNHPNAFMDAMIIAVHTRQKVHFLVRSDVFKGPFVSRLLGSLGMIPVYRIQEGAEQLHKNKDTFDRCKQMLEKNKTILIFSEGICIQERRLRKLKKGTARIALESETEKSHGMGLSIIPIGINYSDPKKFRSSVFVNIGEPIPVDQFANTYRDDKVKGVNDLTKTLEARMKELLVIIEHKTDDRLTEDIEEICLKQIAYSENLNPYAPEDRYRISKRIAGGINIFHQKYPEGIESLKHNTYHYIEELKKLGLRDQLLYKTNTDRISAFRILIRCLYLAASLPLFIFGWITHYLPYRFAYKTADRKAKNIEFHSSVNMTPGMVFTIIFYALQIGLVRGLSPIGFALGYTILLPLSGIFALHYHSYFRKTKGQFRLWQLKRRKPQKLDSLMEQRKVIIAQVSEFIN